MENFEFLQQALGDAGFYCVLGLKKDSDRPIQKFFSSLEQVVAAAKNFMEEGIDAYYALATFEDDKSRKAINVKQLKSLYMDIDCGPNKPYADQAAGVAAVKKFCKDVGLPKPTLVNSGGGVHVYWMLTESVPRETWVPLAEKLKYLTDTHDLFADPAVTADPARVLRVPGTLNYKTETARRVEIIGELGEPVSYDTLKHIIGEPLERKSYIPRGEMDEVTKALVGNFTSRFKTIMMKTVRGEGCQQLQYICENQATMSEPMWRAGLSIAKFCVDGDVAVEKISSGHPEYDPVATEKKVNGIKGGPYTCGKFEEYNPSGCDGCPNKGSIKSPIVLGRDVLEATDEDNVVEDKPSDPQATNTQTYVIPKYPEPYFRGKTGGVYKRIVGKDEEVDVLIYHNDIYVTRRLSDPNAGESIVIRLHMPKDGVREFTVPLTAVTSDDELRKEIARNGVAMAKISEVKNYIIKWVNEMQLMGKADIARTQFGWTDEKMESFVLGDKEICADRIDHNPPSSVTAGFFKMLTPKGTMDNWLDMIEFFNRPGLELHQFLIGACWGSIFTKFTQFHGTVIHVHSPGSGLGKTTAVMAGLTMWGDPEGLMLKDEDTRNSKMNRAEIGNSLPLCIDEVSETHPKELSAFCHVFTQGSQKNRMSGSSNSERLRGDNWQGLAIQTANTPAIAKIAAYKALPDAEAKRIFEILAVKKLEISKPEADKIGLVIKSNYGVAAVPYLQYIMQNIDEVRNLFHKTRSKLDVMFGFGAEDRFHSLAIADSIVAIMVAKKLGLCKFEIKPIIEFLKTVVSSSQEAARDMRNTAEEYLGLFMAENCNNMLRIKSTDDARNNSDPTVQHLVIPEATPRGSLMMRYEYDKKRLYIYPTVLKKWCTDKQLNYQSIVDQLKAGRTALKQEQKRMGKGTHITTPPTKVLSIDCSHFMTDEFEAEIMAKVDHKDAVEGSA